MRFDPALENAVRRQARPGTAFTDPEIRQALHWAVDHLDGVQTPIDGWMTTSPIGRAAVRALAEYEPAPPQPPSTGTVVGRCLVWGALWTIGSLGVLLVLQLAAMLVGFRPHLGISAPAVLAFWLGSSTACWFIRRSIPAIVKPTAPAFPVPQQRAGDDEPRLLGTLPPDPGDAAEHADREENVTP